MAIFQVEKTVQIDASIKSITIETDHKFITGTDSYHIIDVPNNDTYYDYEWRNEETVAIGKATDLIGLEITLYAKALNVKADVETIEVDFKVNGVVCYAHNNLKKDDPTPSIILKINFTK